MSVTVDVNVLVYASNEGDPAHEAARELLERLAAGSELVYLFWPALLGYLRIVTHPAILPRPLPPRLAVRNVEQLLALPHVRAPGEEDGFWQHFVAVAGDHPRGNDVPDAHLARSCASTRCASSTPATATSAGSRASRCATPRAERPVASSEVRKTASRTGLRAPRRG